jgi:hypothetical protein
MATRQSRRQVSVALTCSPLFLVTARQAAAAELSVDEKITISYPPNLSSALAQRFGALLVQERRRLRDWWGPAFEEPIRVTITEERGPSMALVPAWSGDHGTMLMPIQRLRGADAASLHELVHIYAPNGNRFVAESLAVYAHEALKGQRAHPNFGRDLHEMARERTGDISLVELDKVPTPNSLGRQAEPVEAYVAGGSFVRFLIERDGLEKFRTLYALTPLIPRRRAAGSQERWQQIYNRSLAELEKDWRDFLLKTIAAPPQSQVRQRD